MKRFFSMAVIISIASQCFAQSFKNDNVLYKTVDPAGLCEELQKNKGYLLLDVRSPGEHYDTSSFTSLNIGHFKGAKNIEVQQLANRWREIEDYKNKPVFIYCSHSQRSRRASKLLADSGFTRVFNINGGLSSFHYNNIKDKGCLSSLYETSNPYRVISFTELCLKMRSNPFIMDVRSDSAFRHISPDAKTNATGTLKNAINIPFLDLEQKSASIPTDGREIIIIDISGADAAKAAALLSKKGVKNISVLIEGVDRILSMDSRDLNCQEQAYISPVPYKTLNSAEFGRYAKKNPGIVLLDVRTADEYANKYKDSWRNIGHLNQAINIPADQLSTRLNELDKNHDIVVYGFTTGQEVFRSADLLYKNGFTRLHVLIGGIFNIRWTSGNVKGQEQLKDLVVDVPEVNQ